MNVAGIGVIFTRGRGLDCYEQALRRGWVAPEYVENPSLGDSGLPVYRVDDDVLRDKAVLRKTRRADRFTKMAILAAWDAVSDSGVSLEAGTGGLGIIVATALGPHVTTFGFLDDILNYGDANPSPTLFSHSVHNAAAAYVALVLGGRGPTLTLTQFAFSFHQALLLARAWLNEGRCKYVLVGTVDECGAVMEYVCRQKLRTPADGKIRPFRFSKEPEAVPGEGSAFFLLTHEQAPKTYCEIAGVSFAPKAAGASPDLCLIDADGMSGDESGYRSAIPAGAPVAAYTPIFGSMMAGGCFHCVAAALMLEKRTRYACPVPDNPFGLALCDGSHSVPPREASCVRHGCDGRTAVVTLRKEA